MGTSQQGNIDLRPSTYNLEPGSASNLNELKNRLFPTPPGESPGNTKMWDPVQREKSSAFWFLCSMFFYKIFKWGGKKSFIFTHSFNISRTLHFFYVHLSFYFMSFSFSLRKLLLQFFAVLVYWPWIISACFIKNVFILLYF